MSDSDALEWEAEYRKQRYDAYDKEREGLRKASLEVSNRYDKAVLFLAGGGLALSLTFIEKIAPHPRAWSFVILFVAWLLLILSIVLQLHALSASQTAINEQLTLLDAEYESFLRSLTEEGHRQPTETAAPVENKFVVRTRTLNVWSLRALIAGISLLCIFSAINLPFSEKDKNMAVDKNTEVAINESKGSFVPPKNILPPPPPPKPAESKPAEKQPVQAQPK